MKKSLLTFLVTLFGATFLFAQQNPNLGFRGGFNFGNSVLINTNLGGFVDRDHRLSYHFGLTSRFKIIDQLSLTPELLYSSKGYRSEIAVDATRSDDILVSYNYLSLPIFAHYKILDRVSVGMGPEFSYLLAANSRVGSTTSNLIGPLNFNRFETSFGTSISFGLSKKASIDLKYLNGLSGVYEIVFTDEQNNRVDENAKYVNRTFQLSFSYLIN